MHCLHCNTENPEQAKFCLNCGARLAALCPQCTATLPPGARFCTECGAQVEAPLPPAPDTVSERLQRLVPQEYAQRLLATGGQAESERRLVTILFSDIKGSTAMAEALDPEEVMEIMSGALEVLSRPITRHEGTVARLMGDAVLAFFGAPLSHEDDARRACQAGLEIVAEARAYAARLEAERGLGGFDVRVGINTGLVVTGEVGSDQRMEYTAMGDAINLAARMEQHAPAGGILISHHTYRHVRGAFDVEPQGPLTVKGKAEPVRTYLVERARPRAFRKATRGVEGIETPMVGRSAELGQLLDAYYAVVEEDACQVVTVVGEAGVGKSRLLYEFDKWCGSQPEMITTFKGRAGQAMQGLPYALLRDLFNRGFAIQESDAAAVARDKLVEGLTTGPGKQKAGEMKAHIVGQLLGFDFSASPHVQAIGEDAQQLRDRGLVYLGDYFRALAVEQPVLMLLEDLHWAESSSLDAVARLASSVGTHPAHSHAPVPLLIVCTARPSLYQRRPDWGQGPSGHSRLDLAPLSGQDSRHLVDEILQRMERVPAALRELVVGGAEGNPFFLEELIKMLIEEGVIRKGETTWSVDAKRLGDLQVPPTLTGVLQARLDRLPFDQRQVLQQASVVGRLFWDLAVAHIAAAARPDRAAARTEPESEAIGAALAALGGREMVFPQATSAFEGAGEYLFKHALLREVTYEGVLKRVRRVYHGLVAGWMIEQAGERAVEYTGLIADHLALAGRREEAAVYLRRAAEQAAAAYANEEAASYYGRALELTPVEDAEARYRLLLAREGLHDLLGAREEQSRELAVLEPLAAHLDEAEAEGKGLHLAQVLVRKAWYDRAIGDYPQAIADAMAAITAAMAAVASAQAVGASESAADTPAEVTTTVEEAGEPAAWTDESQPGSPRSDALRLEVEARAVWGWALMGQGEFALAHQQLEEALAQARVSGSPTVQAECLSALTAAHYYQGDLTASADAVKSGEILSLRRQAGDRRGEAHALHNYGIFYGDTGDLAKASAYLEQSIEIYREIGDRRLEGFPLGILGYSVHRPRGDYSEAIACHESALYISRETGDRQHEATELVWLGNALWGVGDYSRAEACCEQGLDIHRELGGQDWAARSHYFLGLIRFSFGDYDRSQALLQESLGLYGQTGGRAKEGQCLAVLALLAHRLGDDGRARERGQEALQIGQESIHKESQAQASLMLGHALAGLGDLSAAAVAYGRSFDTYRQAGWRNLPMEALAGLARVALEQGDAVKALLHVEEILDHLLDHTLDGTYEPFRIYLSCVRVLQARGDARAADILRTAHTLLQECAAGIEDERLRRSFLENVPAHRELLAEFERAGLG